MDLVRQVISLGHVFPESLLVLNMPLVIEGMVCRASLKLGSIFLLTSVDLLLFLFESLIDILRPLCYPLLYVYSPLL